MRYGGLRAALLVTVSWMLMGAACGDDVGRASGSIDDLARVVQGSTDEQLAKALISQEATAVGSTGDDVAKQWLPQFESGVRQFEQLDPQARAYGCDVVTSWAGALATPDPSDDAMARIAVGAAASLNQSASWNQFAADLREALDKADRHEPIYLQVLLLKTGICAAVG